MFTTLSQKTITSFFSSSVASASSPTKKTTSPSEVATNGRRTINSDDDGSHKDVKDKTEDKTVKQVAANKEAATKREISSSSSDSDSPNRSKPRLKRIRTYSEMNKSIIVKVPTKRVFSSSSEDEEPGKKENDAEKIGKSQSSKTIDSFFAAASRDKNTGKNPRTSETRSAKKKSPKREDVKPEDYDPANNEYHPIDCAPWKRGEKVPYLALAKTLEAIEGVSSRLKMIDILANFFRSVIVLTPEDLLQCTYLCINKLAPSYEGLELGIGETLLMKAISQTTGRSLDSIRSELADKGDLGLIAESSRSTQRIMFKPARLTVRGVYEKLCEIAKMTGNASMAKKIEKIQVMLVACVQSEARYLIRSLSGKLRIGLAEQSLLAALAQAVTTTPSGQEYPPEILDASENLSPDKFKKLLEENTLILKTTYCECPSYDAIIPVLLGDGIKILPAKCKIRPGIPIKPMLAHPTKGIEEVLRRFENAKFTCEYKYDGERAQIHVIDTGEVQVYSRNQENNTSKYPDIIARMPKAMKKSVRSCILDAEAVAWDVENDQILPFQVLSTRKRKDASESNIKVQVCVFAFDLLYLNGESLVAKSYQERRDLLQDSFRTIDGQFSFVTAMDVDNIEKVETFLEEAIKNKCEGLMVKTLDVDATYEIAKRSHKWLKIKKDYLDGVGDTLDLVVIGGYFGKGKRAGTYGGFLLACYEPENEEFQTICKIGTGFKDEDLVQHSVFLKEHLLAKAKPYYCYDVGQEPDEWFEPVQVWEVKCADLSVSPIYKAAVGNVDPEKGISLRFPRFVRIREDKRPEDATTASQVVALYRNQEQIKNHPKNASSSKDEAEDFY